MHKILLLITVTICFASELEKEHDNCLFVGSTCNADESAGQSFDGSKSYRDTFKDLRDGKNYRTVKIGTQTWMAENISYEIGETRCYAEDNDECSLYGRFYTWKAAQVACPTGWHLPKTEEFNTLKEFIQQQESSRYNKFDVLLASNQPSSRSGNDKYGFSAYIIGSRDLQGNYSPSNCAIFWSKTSDGSSTAIRWSLCGSDSFSSESYNKQYGYSVRCVKN